MDGGAGGVKEVASWVLRPRESGRITVFRGMRTLSAAKGGVFGQLSQLLLLLLVV